MSKTFLCTTRALATTLECYRYFVHDLGEGSRLMGLELYLDTMRWKLVCFLKLTFGIWDEAMVENMEIKYRSSRFGHAFSELR